MSAFRRGTLAAALATAMTVMPSLALAQENVAAKPANEPKVALNNDTKLPFEQVVEYSKANPVIAIGISRGQKDAITGEKIGGTMSELLTKIHGVPSKYFVWSGGDYTSVIFAVKGHIYGPYGLKESLNAMPFVVSGYIERVGSRTSTPLSGASSNVAAKPEPKQ